MVINEALEKAGCAWQRDDDGYRWFVEEDVAGWFVHKRPPLGPTHTIFVISQEEILDHVPANYGWRPGTPPFFH